VWLFLISQSTWTSWHGAIISISELWKFSTIISSLGQ
jgi:hypothetical protein